MLAKRLVRWFWGQDQYGDYYSTESSVTKHFGKNELILSRQPKWSGITLLEMDCDGNEEAIIPTLENDDYWIAQRKFVVPKKVQGIWRWELRSFLKGACAHVCCVCFLVTSHISMKVKGTTLWADRLFGQRICVSGRLPLWFVWLRERREAAIDCISAQVHTGGCCNQNWSPWLEACICLVEYSARVYILYCPQANGVNQDWRQANEETYQANYNAGFQKFVTELLGAVTDFILQNQVVTVRLYVLSRSH